MAYADSLSPLVDAVYEVLCDGAGIARVIPLDTFKRWRGRGLVTEAPPSELRPPAVQFRWGVILPGDHVGRGYSGFTQRYQINLDVAFAFEGGDHLGETDGGDSDSVMRLIAETQRLIVCALEWEGNLTRTRAGLDTGLVSGLLDHVESSEPVLIIKNDPNGGQSMPQRIVVTHRFVGDVQLAPPT